MNGEAGRASLFWFLILLGAHLSVKAAFILAFSFLLLFGCLGGGDSKLPSMPLNELNLQPSDFGAGFVMLGEKLSNGTDSLNSSNTVIFHTRAFSNSQVKTSGASQLPRITGIVSELGSVSNAKESVSHPCHGNALDNCSQLYAMEVGDEAYFTTGSATGIGSNGPALFFVAVATARRGQYTFEVSSVSLVQDSDPIAMRERMTSLLRAMVDRFDQRPEITSTRG